MKTGFIGSRNGMSDDQVKIFKQIVNVLDITEFHHSGCLGADEVADSIVKEIKKDKIKTVIHLSYKKDRADL